MAQRQGTRRFSSDSVQGEGSYVTLRKLTVGETRVLRSQSKKKDDDESFEIGIDTIISHVVGWNWVDDDGQPLPLPKDDPDTGDRLTTEEFKFLAECLTGGEAVKN